MKLQYSFKSSNSLFYCRIQFSTCPPWSRCWEDVHCIWRVIWEQSLLSHSSCLRYVSQFFVCLARFCKVLQIQVLQGFTNRFFGFASFVRFSQWALMVSLVWPACGNLNNQLRRTPTLEIFVM